jgi:hypothetical protein
MANTFETFTKAPEPGTFEAIEAYERGGLGHDTKKSQAHSVTEPMKRLSIDMPASLHRQFKLACTAVDKVTVAEVVVFTSENKAIFSVEEHERCNRVPRVSD